MTNEEKRTLEIIISLIIQHFRKDNTKALTNLRAFFLSMNYNSSFNDTFLYNTCINNIEILSQIPSHQEILLTTQVKSNLFQVKKSTFKHIYSKRLNSNQLRTIKFMGNYYRLQPKIKDKNFHEHLLTFFRNFGIISSAIPLNKEI